jgi:hypothetical protein
MQRGRALLPQGEQFTVVSTGRDRPEPRSTGRCYGSMDGAGTVTISTSSVNGGAGLSATAN